MKTAGNIIWLLLAGIWLFVAYVIAGLLNCIFIITIPFGVQAFKIAGFVLWPFGRTVADRPGASTLGSGCGNVLWFVLGGWYLALTHFVTGVLLCIPIITIPLAIQDFKLARLALAPFGKEVVSNAEAQRRRSYYQAGSATGWQGPSGAPAPPPPPPPTGSDITF
ncbi:MAG: YccF domain-containing protein [Candidatus Dormiibacterota bacterium]